LFTPGMMVVTAIMVAGLGVGLYRLLFGLASVSNLDDYYPFGLWKGLNVAAGIALAAAGFSSAAFVYVFHREHFHAIIRPALLIAILGYTFTGVALTFDLGLWYNIWHPALPSMWQANSVLFEVAMCVMVYLTVLYMEFAPVVFERFIGRVRLPGRLARWNDRIDTLLRLAQYVLDKILFLFIVAGVTVSCLHQSSLGMLYVIAPYKLHPLYWSPLSPIFFLSSAVAAAFPVIIAVLLASSRWLNRQPPLRLVTALARMAPFPLGLYVAFKVGDMLHRGTYVFLGQYSVASVVFWIEFGLLTVVPCLMFMSADVRRSPNRLLLAAVMYIAGVLLNRCAVFFIAYQPLYAEKAYFPAFGEIALTLGLIATMVFIYRVVVTLFPVLPASPQEA